MLRFVFRPFRPKQFTATELNFEFKAQTRNLKEDPPPPRWRRKGLLAFAAFQALQFDL